MRRLIILTFLIPFAINLFGQTKSESLKIIWPEEYKWKIGSNQENNTMHFMELIPGNEKITKWTMMGTMMSLKKVKVTSTDQVVQMYTESSLKESPTAKLTVIEKSDSTKNIWVLYKIETPSFPNDPKPESQLFYALQGEDTLYVNFIAIKDKTLSEDIINKWAKVFKSSELVY